MYTYVYMYVQVQVFVCVYVHLHKQTARQTRRHTDTQTHRHTFWSVCRCGPCFRYILTDFRVDAKYVHVVLLRAINIVALLGYKAAELR